MDRDFIRQVRTHLDSIRRTCHRPTVAVVLSGGGAKGAAEVGALKYLEEKGIPVDFICGTSIGGLVGGLYAVGYKSEDLRDLFVTQDWGTTLTDHVDNRFYSYRSKMYNYKYIISIPFKYEEEDFMTRVLEQRKYSSGVKDRVDREGSNNLLSSLPSGYVYGFNVNNLLASLTVGYQDSISFAKLPIPYACVASDMVTCDAKNWGSGTLKEAMRSTMSIPGLFKPVRTQGMVLVDGGTRNNFPTDIAKAVGADYIIGIELSDLSPNYSQVNNILDVLSQFIKMLGRDSFVKNLDEADVVVKPDLEGFNMLSFKPEAVDTMILRGYLAAQSQSELIDEIKSVVPNAVTTLSSRKATDIRKEKVQIKSVTFEGVTDRESLILHRIIGLSAGDWVGNDEIVSAMSLVQATGTFENVQYSLLGRDNPYSLVFKCVKCPIHQVGLGVRLDTEEWVSIALNLGLNAHKLMGPKLDFSAKVGQSQSADLKYSIGTPGHPAFNVKAAIANYYGQLMSNEFLAGTPQPSPTSISNIRNDASYWSHKEMVYISQMMWKRLNLEVGAKSQNYVMSPYHVFGNTLQESLGHEVMKGGYLGLFADMELCSFDDRYYPRKGISLDFNYNFDPIKYGVTNFRPIHAFGLDFKGVIPFGERVALIPEMHFRSKFNNELSLDPQGKLTAPFSMAHLNYAGGFMPDRYIEGQVPYFGVNHVFYTRNQLANVKVDLRVRAADDLYLSLMAGALQSSDQLSGLFTGLDSSLDYAFGFEAGFNSLVGPIKFNFHWDKIVGCGAYFSVGYDF